LPLQIKRGIINFGGDKMPDITIIQNEYATLLYYPDTKIVHHTFHKPIGGQEFRDVLNTGAKSLQEYGASKWLSDDRGNSALSPEDTEWSMTDWFPRAIKAGWKYWALVVPQDILARMNLKEFVDSYYKQGLRIMVFSKPQEAMEWLESVGVGKS
jgi:hypothetical protein